MFIKVNKITADKLNEIARLHKMTYPSDHFTSRFSPSLLSAYYKKLVATNPYSLVAVTQDGNCVGVAIAGENTEKSVKDFIRKNWFRLIPVLLTNPFFILKKMMDFTELFFENKRRFRSKAKMRYLNLLVHPDLMRLGIAAQLTAELEKEFIHNGIKMYGHSVKSSNEKTIQFHLKNGCEIEFRKGNLVYFIKKLDQVIP